MKEALAKEKATWIEMARNLVEEPNGVAKPADTRTRHALEKAGDSAYASCKACHAVAPSRR